MSDSTTRSDLPLLGVLPPDSQKRLVGALWNAWRKAEPSALLAAAASDQPHPAFVASCAEMVETVLAEMAVDQAHLVTRLQVGLRHIVEVGTFDPANCADCRKLAEED